MKKFLTTFFIFILTYFAFIYIGCNSSSSDNGSAILFGRVADSITGVGRSCNVTITSTNFSKTISTDTLGNYKFLNLEGGTYGLKVQCYQYFSKVISGIVVPSDDSLRVDVSITATNVVTYYDNRLDEYFNPTSVSAYILNMGTVCAESNTNKDIQLFDTIGVAGDTSMIISSGDLDSLARGYQTRFSSSLPGAPFTSAQFDALTTYAGLTDPNNPDPSFPYASTDVITFPTAPKTVYAVYLRGKYTGSNPRIFGLMYIDSLGYFNGRFTHFKLKLNLAGQNYFGIFKK